MGKNCDYCSILKTVRLDILCRALNRFGYYQFDSKEYYIARTDKELKLMRTNAYYFRIELTESKDCENDFILRAKRLSYSANDWNLIETDKLISNIRREEIIDILRS